MKNPQLFLKTTSQLSRTLNNIFSLESNFFLETTRPGTHRVSEKSIGHFYFWALKAFCVSMSYFSIGWLVDCLDGFSISKFTAGLFIGKFSKPFVCPLLKVSETVSPTICLKDMMTNGSHCKKQNIHGLFACDQSFLNGEKLWPNKKDIKFEAEPVCGWW